MISQADIPLSIRNYEAVHGLVARPCLHGRVLSIWSGCYCNALSCNYILFGYCLLAILPTVFPASASVFGDILFLELRESVCSFITLCFSF